MTIRKGTITIGTTKINWKQDANGIKYSDGRILQDTSFDTTDAKLAYKYAEAIKEPRAISWNDFKQLKDIQDQDFALIPGDYRNQGQARIENFSRVSVSFAKSQFGEKNGVSIEMIGQHNDVEFIGGLNTNGAERFFQYKPNNSLVSNNIVIRDAVSDNGGGIFGNDGNLGDDGWRSPIKGLKVLNTLTKNCPAIGQSIYAYAVEDAEISGNYFENNNTWINNDTGMIIILGNGKISSNRAFNYQGHLVRSQPMQVLSEGKVLDMNNNFAMGTRKYGMFESQVFNPYYSANKLFKPADVNIFNNTGGRFNSSNDWDAMFLDLYTSFNKISFYNNVGFEMKRTVNNKVGTSNIGDMINHNEDLSNTRIVRNDGNKYFDTIEQAMAFQKANPGIGSDLVL